MARVVWGAPLQLVGPCPVQPPSDTGAMPPKTPGCGAEPHLASSATVSFRVHLGVAPERNTSAGASPPSTVQRALAPGVQRNNKVCSRLWRIWKDLLSSKPSFPLGDYSLTCSTCGKGHVLKLPDARAHLVYVVSGYYDFAARAILRKGGHELPHGLSIPAMERFEAGADLEDCHVALLMLVAGHYFSAMSRASLIPAIRQSPTPEHLLRTIESSLHTYFPRNRFTIFACVAT